MKLQHRKHGSRIVIGLDGFARVELTKGQVALITTEQIPAVQGYCWRAMCNTNRPGWGPYAAAEMTLTDAAGNRRRATVYMHRHLCPGAKEVDHINHDTLDNRAGNLRPATTQQNQANSRRRRDNTSGRKGVCWNKKARKWFAYIGGPATRRFLGSFEFEDEAARAYNAAAKLRWGEFAMLNCLEEAPHAG